MRRFPLALILLISLTLLVAAPSSHGAEPAHTPVEISGRYPDLAMFNRQGECGTGAVVPWAGHLWVITYAPHEPKGSDDKLYEIAPDLSRRIRPESVGGTPADRMIHRESNQLIIGPYLIDASGNVRVIPPAKMPGRLTAAARHLTDPANKVYVYDMEGALFEVDVHTLAVKRLFARVAPGAHGKGAYTGQDRLVIANNGNAIVNKAKPAAPDAEYNADPEAAGCLAEWDGKTWRVVQPRQFTNITGPGGIEGSPDGKAPLWALGWDKRSVILALRDHGTWQNFRLPISDYSYVAKHGWYTEWPRIREVAPGKLLMNMHGGWFEFPKSFAAGNTGGIRPIGDYLKINGDFCGWNDRIVFGCDDASIMQNPLLGQSQSNLWFTTWDGLSQCGRPSGAGGPWVDDAVKANEPSEPYLFNGYSQRVVHLSHDAEKAVTFTFEVDPDGRGKWTPIDSVKVPPHGYAWHVFPEKLAGEWIRIRTDLDCSKATVYFTYGPGGGANEEPELFKSLTGVLDQQGVVGGTLRPLGKDRGTLLYMPDDGAKPEELGADLKLKPYDGPIPAEPKDLGAGADYSITSDEASAILVQKGKRYRLPVFDADAFKFPGRSKIRSIREVVTERFIVNAGGSMFMLPRPTAGGAMRIKPICSHGKYISDFCSWRGLLVLAGLPKQWHPDGHVVGQGWHFLWLGDIDDLWKMGKPRGQGGPWLKAAVKAGEPSDPYLMAGYDQKSLELSHDAAAGPVRFMAEVDFRADGTWEPFHTFEVPPGKPMMYEFPSGYSAHWVRFRCDTACNATARLVYR